MCWHKYKYLGSIRVHKFLGGVPGGVPVEVNVYAKQCTKCGKLKEVK